MRASSPFLLRGVSLATPLCCQHRVASIKGFFCLVLQPCHLDSMTGPTASTGAATAVAVAPRAAATVATTVKEWQMGTCCLAKMLILALLPQLAAAFPSHRQSTRAIKPADTDIITSAPISITAVPTANAKEEGGSFSGLVATGSVHHQFRRHQHQQEKTRSDHAIEQQHQNLPEQQEEMPTSRSPSYLQSDEDPFAKPPERHYLCRYAPTGRGCGSRQESGWPSQLYCKNNECCSKTKCVRGSCGGWCSSEWALCSTSVVYNPEYSYGKCQCSNKGSLCPPNTVCMDEHEDYGGAYCICKEGYILTSGTCIENPCKAISCYPGTCELEGITPYCKCPEGYFSQGMGPYSTCQMEDICRTNPCGDNKAALDCTPLTPTEYKCTCTTGYEVDKSSGQQKCVPIESRIKCADLPCGAEGLDRCEDTDEGFNCVCKSGYRLVDAAFGRKCEFQNPCESNVCGPPAAVLSCSADEVKYSCQCQTGYTLFTGTNSQFCQADEAGGEYNTYILAGLGIGMVVVLGMLAIASRNRNRPVRNEALDSPDQSMGASSTAGAYPAGGNTQQLGLQQNVQASASGWA